MGKEILTFGDIEIKKKFFFYHHKTFLEGGGGGWRCRY